MLEAYSVGVDVPGQTGTGTALRHTILWPVVGASTITCALLDRQEETRLGAEEQGAMALSTRQIRLQYMNCVR